jgi:ribosomal protein S12 methylthiotransferase accessory factor YcaO
LPYSLGLLAPLQDKAWRLSRCCRELPVGSTEQVDSLLQACRHEVATLSVKLSPVRVPSPVVAVTLPPLEAVSLAALGAHQRRRSPWPVAWRGAHALDTR